MFWNWPAIWPNFLRVEEANAAAPMHQATGTKQSGTGALTVAWPTHAANDVALLFVESENQAITLTTANGFQEIGTQQGTGTAAAASATRLAVYWARATSGAMASPVVADSGDHTFAVIVTYRGVITTGNPYDAIASSVTTPAGLTTSFDAVTTTVNDALIVMAASVDLDGNSTAVWSAFANLNLSGLTERFDRTVNTGDGGGLGVADGMKASMGDTTATVGTHTLSITAQMTIALKPEPTITVAATGTQTSAVMSPFTNQYVGGAFTFVRNELSTTVTSITVSETDASLSAQTYLANLDLYYETAGTCTYDGGETLFGTDTAFDGSEDAVITGSMTVSTSQICVYAVVDVASGAPDGDTFDLEITDPSTEVVAAAGLVSPASAVAISGATTVNQVPNTILDHYRWRNDDGPQGNTAQTLYFNPTGNGFGTAEFGIVGASCAGGSEWDCVDDGGVDTSVSAPTTDAETTQLLLAAATDYYTLADDVLLSGSTVTQLDITIEGADDIGNPNTSVTLGYCVVGGAAACGTSDAMGIAQRVTGADQVKTQQFTGLSLSTSDLNNLQLVLTGSGAKAEISTLYVLVTYSTPEATWAQSEDIAHTGLAKSTNVRLRFQVDNTGGSASGYTYRLEYAEQSGTCDTSYSGESYAQVPDTATTQHFDMTTSAASGYVDGDPTTAKLSNGEALTFVAGDTVESTSNSSGAITLAQNQYTEIEYVFQANTNATDGGVYCFRVTNGGTALTAADAVAQVTLASGGGTISADIVDAAYATVASPSVVMSTATFSFGCQTITGTLGTSTQQMYVNNDDGADNGWTLTIAAQATTDVWDSAGTDYDYNDPTGSDCTDGADAGDNVGGRMTIDASVATLAVGECGSCTTSNVSKGSSASFSEGVTDSITLLTGAAASDDIGDWTLRDIGISQTLPAEQPAASDYDISLTLTITAS